MSVDKIDDALLLSENRYHVSQTDVPGKTASEMKAFMDYVPREILIPKVNELVNQVNFILDASEGDEYTYSKAQVDEKVDEVRTFVPPWLGMSFSGGFYCTADVTQLDAEDYFSTTAEDGDYWLADVIIPNGGERQIYIRKNYSGTYSIHAAPTWSWNKNIGEADEAPIYVDATGWGAGNIKITNLHDVARRYFVFESPNTVAQPIVSKGYVEEAMAGKAGVGDIYTKDEIDALIAALPQHADYITEQGTVGMWKYRKWSNGDAECWGKATDNFTLTAQVGSTGLYRSDAYATVYPEGLFKGIQSVMIQPLYSSLNADMHARLVKGSPEQIQWCLVSSVSSDSMSIAYVANVKGKWK